MGCLCVQKRRSRYYGILLIVVLVVVVVVVRIVVVVVLVSLERVLKRKKERTKERKERPYFLFVFSFRFVSGSLLESGRLLYCLL